MLTGVFVDLVVFDLSVKKIFPYSFSGETPPRIIQADMEDNIGDGFRSVDDWNVVDCLGGGEAHKADDSLELLPIRITDQQDRRWVAAG